MRYRILLLLFLAFASIASFPVGAQALPLADLSVSQVSLTNPIVAGTGFNYQITVTNTGPNAADNVRLVDTLPTGVIHQSNTSGCSEAPVGTLNCNLGRIEAGTSRVVTITVHAASNLVNDATGTSSLRNTVAVSSSSISDPNLVNNSNSLTSPLIASSDLSIVSMEIVNPPSEIPAGETVEIYLHTVINNAGPSTPIDVSFVANASSEDGSSIEPLDFETQELDLALNESRSLDTVFEIQCENGVNTFSFEASLQALPTGSRDSNLNNNSASAELTIECVAVNAPEVSELNVSIDIRPDNEENNINLRSNGEIQVAILSDATIDFDASTVDPATIRFAGASVAREGNGDYKTDLRDVNDDGMADLILHIETDEIELTTEDTNATLRGETFDGLEIYGSDRVRIVGRGNANGNGNGNGNSNGNSNGNGNGNGNGNSNGNGNGRGN